MKILFEIIAFFASILAFENSLESFGIVIVLTKEMQINALSKNEMLPAVNTSLFGETSKIVSLETFVSLLWGLEVIAVAFFAIFATLMFVIVFPDIETK